MENINIFNTYLNHLKFLINFEEDILNINYNDIIEECKNTLSKISNELKKYY